MGEFQCNCGRVFSTPEERTMHAATCSAMKPADPLHQQAEALAKENANLLRGWIRGQRIGGCRLLSEGAHCKCPLCLLDAIMDCHREALQRVQAETREEDAQQVESIQPDAGYDNRDEIEHREGELFMRKAAAAAIRARKDRP